MDPARVDKPRQKCAFIVKKKNRQCRMLALKGSLYCGEHVINEDNAFNDQISEGEQRRIKCPLDGSHTCFARNLQRHLRVCNARVTHVPTYHVQDVNSGDGAPHAAGTTIHQLTDAQLTALLDKISRLYHEHVAAVEEAGGSGEHPLLSSSLRDPQLGTDSLKHLRQNSAILALMERHGLLSGARTYVELGSGKARLSSWLARGVTSQARIVLVDRASHRHKAENKLKDEPDVCQIQRLKIDIRHLRLAGCEACVGRPLVFISKHLCGAATDLGLRAAVCGQQSVPTCRHAQQSVSSCDTTSSGEAPAAGQSGSGDTPAAVTGEGPAPRTEANAAVDACVGAEPEDDPSPGSGDGTDAAQPAARDAGAVAGQNDRGDTETAAEQKTSELSEDWPQLDVCAILIALCCHHRLDWCSYVGKQFLQECGFSGPDLAALRGVAAWATCSTPSWDAPAPKRRRTSAAAADFQAPGPAPKSASITHDSVADATNTDGAGSDANGAVTETAETSCARYQRLGLSPERRTQLGFQCKRLLDEGRRRFLEDRGFRARLVRYVPSDVSPENVLLLATRHVSDR